MGKTVFTNGCFDILHPGHIDLLERARALGDRLIVGINSDNSVQKIKGTGRPFVNETARRDVLLGLRSVDQVEIFDEPTPQALIERIRPDILVKGGDWKTIEIIGADLVLANGGEVLSLPLKGNFSTSDIAGRITAALSTTTNTPISDDVVKRSIEQHQAVFDALLSGHGAVIRECAAIIIDTFRNGNKVLVCGNGGSAADAQHLAAEFVGRYETERRALPSIALTTDTSAITAISNDYGFDQVFARQVDANAVSGDCLVAISTSGNSPNVIAAVMSARRRGCRVIGLTGGTGKKLAGLCDACILVPSDRTARVQEAHITISHIWCEMVDVAFAA